MNIEEFRKAQLRLETIDRLTKIINDLRFAREVSISDYKEKIITSDARIDIDDKIITSLPKPEPNELDVLATEYRDKVISVLVKRLAEAKKAWEEA